MSEQQSPEIKQEERSITDLTLWALTQLFEEETKTPPDKKGIQKFLATSKREKQMKPYAHAIVAAKAKDFRLAQELIKSKADSEADHVATGNILADVWGLGSSPGITTETPLQRSALFYNGLSVLLGHEIYKQAHKDSSLSKHDLHEALETEVRGSLGQMALGPTQELNYKNDQELLEQLYRLRAKIIESHQRRIS